MTITESMQIYFKKLDQVYWETFKTYPTVSWDPSYDQTLFCSTPDEDGEIQWRPRPGAVIPLPGICPEVMPFFTSFYFWSMRGVWEGIELDFPSMPNSEAVKGAAEIAVMDGDYYFYGQKTLLLANACKDENDDLLLFYRQPTNELFLYDQEFKCTYPLKCTLSEMIGTMKAVI